MVWYRDNIFVGFVKDGGYGDVENVYSVYRYADGTKIPHNSLVNFSI